MPEAAGWWRTTERGARTARRLYLGLLSKLSLPSFHIFTPVGQNGFDPGMHFVFSTGARRQSEELGAAEQLQEPD